MDKWNLEFGVVDVWDDEGSYFAPASLTLNYDGSNPFPFSLEADFTENNAKIRTTGKDLIIECHDTGVTNINDDFTCILSAEQKETLLSVQGKWEYKPSCPPEPDLIDRVAGAYAKDFGVVFYYDTENAQFVTANLMIDFDWSSSNPIITLLRIYDEDRCPKTKTNGQYPNLTYNYEGVVEGLAHYEICNSHYLLTQGQVNLLNYVANLLNK